MEVHISEVVSTARAVSGDALLSQRTLDKIVRTVLSAMQAQRAAEERAKRDRRVSSRPHDEQDGEN